MASVFCCPPEAPDAAGVCGYVSLREGERGEEMGDVNA